MKILNLAARSLVLIISMFALAGCGPEGTGPTIGELLQKGAKKASTPQFAAVMPLKVFFVWPTKEGEDDLIFKPDGTLSGSAKHYASNTTSSAVGTWIVDEQGKFCVEKKLADWNTTVSRCYFAYIHGFDVFLSLDTDNNSKTFPLTAKK